MEVIEHTILNSCSDIFSIYPLGDIHGGSIDCAEDEIKKKVEEVRTNRNAFGLAWVIWLKALPRMISGLKFVG